MDLTKRWQKTCLMIAALALPLLGGCAGPKNITLSSEATTALNRDKHGKPLSVVVQVYQLKSDQGFKLLTPDLLASGKPIADVLGASVISSKELIFVPGGKQELDMTILEDANYVGVIGYFRQPNPHFWRLLYDAGRVRSKDLKFKVDDCYLQAIKPEAIQLPDQPNTGAVDCSTARN
ncbi:type VI secretion system lipoprotein TssJ [Chromobacterium subtsugae]|uniref:Type VI secretion system lipoprotein TssJ n=1 Tax=Chromobacterium subtsugae TaxID=251747 RepID=A0ABS7FJQ4_9NEIS|nr:MULTISPECIES: type VI secretion system lipoprotein TssJ [Chromobacterium]MBW7569194.1 type VI secretion system lipoprotein TssJ [Chromobacterium subtsugae]MBW8290310.1 type VI secretion system lipoprotein TssJ [Chromobacterium subtsugae]WSE91227.1 type VI secretion system lipoprotein TssJ [Chromobacterium subtsugae]WVH59602.1 type VI secretion system lipoprotein TssJ [Chromobacterium subtsugae]